MLKRKNRAILVLVLAIMIAMGRIAAQGYWNDESITDLPQEIKEIFTSDTPGYKVAALSLPKVGTEFGGTASTNSSANQKGNSHKAALIRLEDIGPGGNYGSLEDLGRLRAVVDYLYSQGIPFHVAVVPRFKTLNPDGSWKNNGIDDPSPTPETRAFIRLLYYMKERGGILGVHGYTHQYGESRMPDDSQNSGTGNEFNTGDDQTASPAYAQVRVELAARAFQQLNLEPEFWETPHSVATPEQHDVFRAAFGIQYESLNKKDLTATYLEGENQFLGTSLGSVNVPTPLYYVEGGTGAGNSVEHILRRMIFFSGLASFFYHPFLEYQFLEPVSTLDGKPVVVDGIPLYRYAEGSKSYLHRLVNGLQDWGYRFTSIHEVVPFTPGHRLKLLAGEDDQWLIGDFNGDHKTELLVKNDQQIKVLIAKLQIPRWSTSTYLSDWLELSGDIKDAVVRKGDFNHDGKEDLVFYQPLTGQWSVALSDGTRFSTPQPWLTGWAVGKGLSVYIGDFNGDGYDDLMVFNPKDQSWQIAENNQNGAFLPQAQTFTGLGEASLQLSVGDMNGDGTDDLIAYNTTSGRVQVALIKAGKITKPQTWLTDGDRFREMITGDFNGDSRCDLLFHSSPEGTWNTYLSTGRTLESTLLPYGPWAPGDKRMSGVGDFNGDGKSDLASVEKRGDEWLIDLSYSYQK